MSMEIKDMVQRIDTAIRESGRTNVEIAKAVKVTPEAIRQWRTGQATPKIPNIQALAAVLGCSDDFLLVGYNRNDFGQESKFKARHINLLERYLALPSELRNPIRSMIYTLTVAGSDHYHVDFKRKLAVAAEKKPPDYKKDKT